MLAHGGAGLAHAARRFGEARHDALHTHAAQFRIGHANDGLARLELRIGEDIGDVVDRREADLVAGKSLAQLLQSELADGGADDLVQRVAVLHARRIGGKAGVGQQVVEIEGGAEADEDALRRGRDRGPFVVGGAIDIARRCILAAVARAGAHGAQLVVFDGEEFQRAQHGLGGRAVDLLATPFGMAHEVVQGGQNAQRAEQARHGIGNRIAQMQRLAAFLAADLGEAAHRLEDARESWPSRIGSVLAEARDAQDGETRIDRPQPVAGDAPAVERARPEILDQDVAADQQAAEQGAALGFAQVERDALLVAVGDFPPQRHAVLVRGERAQAVAGARDLDLDDVGAVVAQQAGGKGPGDHRGNIDDLQSGQGARDVACRRAGLFFCHDGSPPAHYPICKRVMSGKLGLPFSHELGG